MDQYKASTSTVRVASHAVVNSTIANNIVTLPPVCPTCGSRASAEGLVSPLAAAARPSLPTAKDNLELARVFFFSRYIKNGQVQRFSKGDISDEEQAKDPELKLHWTSVLTYYGGNVKKALDWIRVAARHVAEIKFVPERPSKPTKPIVKRSRVKIPDPLANWFHAFYIARGQNISPAKDVTIAKKFKGLSYQSQLQKLAQHCGKTPDKALESLRKRIGSVVKK